MQVNNGNKLISGNKHALNNIRAVGNGSYLRLTVYPEADAVPDYVYGDRYVCTDDPRITCMVYEEDDSVKAVFRIADYSGSMERRITSWERITSE